MHDGKPECPFGFLLADSRSYLAILACSGEDEVKKPWNPVVSVAYLYQNGYNKGHIRHVFFTI